MATGTFTYNALSTKTLKGRVLDKSNAVRVRTTAIKPYPFHMPSGLSLVRKA